MCFCLQAIIGIHQPLIQPVSRFEHARLIALVQDLAIIPLTDDLYNELGVGGEVERFLKLSTRVEEWVEQLSCFSKVAYIEAEFFDSIDDESVVVWEEGERILGPLHSKNSINEALRLLGARVNSPLDEFDSIGLGRHRDTSQWI